MRSFTGSLAASGGLDVLEAHPEGEQREARADGEAELTAERGGQRGHVAGQIHPGVREGDGFDRRSGADEGQEGEAGQDAVLHVFYLHEAAGLLERIA